jgi:aryl-alcohol dehydrogenase-like predicted oxidoreductase
MNYRRLGRTGLKVSELGLGTMQFGWTTDEKGSVAVLDSFVGANGTFIDTADIYTMWGPRGMEAAGESETIIGRWMAARRNRQRIVLATKVRGKMWEGPDGEGLSRARVIRCCEDSLRRLKTDYIDLYQCHWVDLETPIDETLSALNDLVRWGKVRYIGASNYPAWRLMEALAASERHSFERFVSYQPQYSLMERAGFEIEAMPLCRHHGLGVIPYSPLACGFLTGKYRKGVDVASIRAREVRELYANDRGFALIARLEAISQAPHQPRDHRADHRGKLGGSAPGAARRGRLSPGRRRDGVSERALGLSKELAPDLGLNLDNAVPGNGAEPGVEGRLR